ncbi:sulfite exporter TauE/SafE family protein (plasmid) [Rhizobium leguminosarum]|uniref:Probable membrane transporter protein n=1 Tax=Rhizobium leguminosarum TaxID=384 RepID=A0A4Q8XSC5_RHILE|nr:sulfite exporter TauE/SafE family protein [Rhizobium leguminosarum]TAV43975.1 sulfite exporter TauE/SafE family protein [Rhizobium leguminosarum]TAV44408.1 sulfite exporter TauE/SafE family protein [Rhizobium leguminosarum]TAV62784.1 sulfite exporter TauE/SafE family protein [Rhizobium leguminosarum]TAX47443.1 sulfite exporter TauE/SafE family protein [Rhizobium leguminosarum]TAX47864.1 sulfite exporter TauE/SafE family protein [Rhizobium leguminosarum]
MYDIMLLFLAGLLAGSMNALAGGGSFVSLPALISVGVPSVAANATSTLALFPGGMASSWVYRDGVRSVCGVNVVPIAIVTVIGGVAGSLLLLLTPSRIFDGLLPWLLLVATLMLTAGPRLSARFQTQARPSVLVFATVQFFLGLYGGYFGGAVGLMMLAAWSALGGGDIKSLNPTRMAMVTAANAVAVVVFVLAGAIVWQECIPMTVGAVIGGWIGAHIGRRLPSSVVRVLTLAVAFLTTAVFFSRAYL